MFTQNMSRSVRAIALVDFSRRFMVLKLIRILSFGLNFGLSYGWVRKLESFEKKIKIMMFNLCIAMVELFQIVKMSHY